jgi:hypothetical protein
MSHWLQCCLSWLAGLADEAQEKPAPACASTVMLILAQHWSLTEKVEQWKSPYHVLCLVGVSEIGLRPSFA